MPTYTTIKVESDGTLALITLNRPEKRNAISATMIAEFLTALNDVESGGERMAIITGAGKAFCAGMDLDALKSLATQSPEQNLADAPNRWLQRSTARRWPEVAVSRRFAISRSPFLRRNSVIRKCASDLFPHWCPCFWKGKWVKKWRAIFS
jgi:enoyl-CoA hydratase/carnithine racemase